MAQSFFTIKKEETEFIESEDIVSSYILPDTIKTEQGSELKTHLSCVDIDNVSDTEEVNPLLVNASDVIQIKSEQDQLQFVKSEILHETYDLPSFKREGETSVDVQQGKKWLKISQNKCLMKKKHQCPACFKNFMSVGQRNQHFNAHFDFSLVGKRNKHLKEHVGKYLITCKFCGKFLTNKTEFLQHMLNYKLKYASNRKDIFKCEICLCQFHQKIRFQKHMTNHENDTSHVAVVQQLKEPQFMCILCLKHFTRRVYLKRHKLDCKNRGKLFKCDICCKQFISKLRLVLHLPSHSDHVPNQCKICLKQLSSKFMYAEHMRIHNGEKSLQCDSCLKVFSHRQILVRHRRNKCENTEIFKCDTCSEQFATKFRLIVHLPCFPDTAPNQCNFCRKQLSSKASLIEHLRIHTGEKPLKCKSCFKHFSRRRNLSRHYCSASASEKSIFKCNTCSKHYATKANLTRHLSSKYHINRVNERNLLKCDICSRRFINKTYLEQHKNYVHLVGIKHICHICSGTFDTNWQLIRHMWTHSEEPRFNHNCNICSAKFDTYSALNAHLVIHVKAQQQEAHKCKECSKCFETASHLKTHMWVHFEQQLKKCEFCNKLFLYKRELDQHNATHHSI